MKELDLFDVFEEVSFREKSTIIRDGGANKILAATPARLVHYLTSPESIDYALLGHFFLVFRLFLMQVELLELLSLRYKRVLASKDQHGRSVRIRVFVVLRHWLLNYFADDFIPNVELRSGFTLFFKEIQEAPGAQGIDRKIARELGRYWDHFCGIYWDSILCTLEMSMTGSSGPIQRGNSRSPDDLSPADSASANFVETTSRDIVDEESFSRDSSSFGIYKDARYPSRQSARSSEYSETSLERLRDCSNPSQLSSSGSMTSNSVASIIPVRRLRRRPAGVLKAARARKTNTGLSTALCHRSGTVASSTSLSSSVFEIVAKQQRINFKKERRLQPLGVRASSNLLDLGLFESDDENEDGVEATIAKLQGRHVSKKRRIDAISDDEESSFIVGDDVGDHAIDIRLPEKRQRREDEAECQASAEIDATFESWTSLPTFGRERYSNQVASTGINTNIECSRETPEVGHSTNLLQHWLEEPSRLAPARTPLHFLVYYDVHEVAGQLTAIEQQLCSSIDWLELLSVDSTDLYNEISPHQKHPTVSLIKSRYLLFRDWLVTEIVKTQSMHERSCLLSRLIVLAEYLISKLSNYATSVQIILALESKCVQRLVQTWHSVPRKILEIFHYLCEKVSPMQGWDALQTEMNHCATSSTPTPMIPFLAPYILQLHKISKLPSLVSSKLPDCKPLVNFEKHTETAQIVEDVLKMTELARCYKISRIAAIYDRCLLITPVSQEVTEIWSARCE